MKKKNIALFIFSLSGGGAERIVLQLAQGLQKRGYNITLVLLTPKLSYTIPEDIKLMVLPKSKLFGFLGSLFAFKRFCRNNKIDCVISLLTQPNYLNVLSKLIGNNPKVIVSEHTYQSLWRKQDKLYTFLKTQLIGFLYNKADSIICVSQKIKEDLEVNYNVNKQLLNVIYNPFDLKKIEMLGSEKELVKSFSTENFNILSIGTLYDVKNHKMLLKGFANANVKNKQLYILGDGLLLEDLKKLAIELNIDEMVHFLGFVANPYKYLKNGSLLVLSSKNEGLPNVIIEALNCGCPVISTDCISGPREILAPDTDIAYQLKDRIEYAKYGVLTPVLESTFLSEAITKLASDNELLEYYRQIGSERASYFNENNSIDQYINLIES